MESIIDVASLDPAATAEEAHAVAPDTLRNGMKADVAKIIETARTSWLTKYQVLYLLEHRKALGLPLSTMTPQMPPSASMGESGCHSSTAVYEKLTISLMPCEFVAFSCSSMAFRMEHACRWHTVSL
jgi:hypothetical protein